MRASRAQPRALALALLALLLAGWAAPAAATHFRGGWIEYEVQGDGLTVDFRIVTAWRASFGGTIKIKMEWGDGSTTEVFPFDTGAANINELYYEFDGSYRMTEILQTHTYAAGLAGTSVKVRFESGDRLSTIINSADSRFAVSSVLTLAAGVESAKLSVPAVLQVRAAVE